MSAPAVPAARPRAMSLAAPRRILALWFPRLAAERIARRGGLPEGPLAVVGETANLQFLACLSEAAEAAGLSRGQPLRDALALCPRLVTRAADPAAEAVFLSRLGRWAGRFTPWVGAAPPDGLVLDITGCAHLFGGEAELVALAAEQAAGIGMTLETGLADTVGAAWALARYAGRASGVPGAEAGRSGDDIDQEARATRSRAGRRHWTKGGAPPAMGPEPRPAARIAAPGMTRQALAPLPVAALRLPQETVAALARVGLRRVGDLLPVPRAALSRRYGLDLLQRLDQALGLTPEPVSPLAPAAGFAVRLSLPEPIGLAPDILAGIDRLLPPLCARLRAKGRGARRIAFEAQRSDHRTERVEIGLARPTAQPEDLRPLLALKVEGIDPGLGIDVLRIEAVVVEPLHPRQATVRLAAPDGREPPSAEGRFDLLLARLGARVGMEALTRCHPGDSHIPEKAAQTLMAAWSEPAGAWPAPPVARPLTLFAPEPVACPETPRPPARFRWRRRAFTLAAATGPERIAPEWWLDEPAWRSGPRDYWRVETAEGARLWLFYAHGGAVSGGWFCQGEFA